MDHLPKVQADPANPPIIVPFLCLQAYDKGDFEGYPSRRCFDPDIPESQAAGWTDGSGYTLYQRTSIFQEWLFFGVLTEVFDTVGVSIAVDDFIRGASVTTEKLADYVRRFASMVSRLVGEPRAAAARRIEACLATVRLYARFRPPGAMVESLVVACPERWPVVLSITILAESLSLLPNVPWSEGYMQSIQDERISLAAGLMTTRAPSLMEELLRERMKDAGWCPNQIAGFPSMDASFAYYLGMLAPIKKRTHNGCFANFCAHTQLDGGYTMRHASNCDGQNCDTFDVDLRNLETIIEKQDLPVVQVEKQQDGSISIRVAHRDPSKNYIAISHVWSHGLGNPNTNSLPSCQIFRIWHLLKQFHPKDAEAGFWIDTLCVPISGPCRKSSICRMGSIYRQARVVLVLDEELQQTGADAIERVTRLSSSTWQRRLWTLQEASLNPEWLFIQFRDAAILSHTLIEDALQHPTNLVSTIPGKAQDPILYLYFFRNYQYMLEADISFKDQESPSSIIFLTLLETLTWRTTSKASDEPLCIATILGMDTAPLLELSDTEDRMKFFLRSLPRIPQDIIFFSGPKLTDTPGLRWAPKSFLRKNGFPFPTFKWTSLTAMGLPVVADGTILSVSHLGVDGEEEEEEEDEDEEEKPSHSISKNIIALRSPNNPSSLYLLRDCTTTGDERPINLSEIHRPGLIFRHENDNAGDWDWMACLVTVERRISSPSTEPIHAQFRSLVSLNKVAMNRIQHKDGQCMSVYAGRALGMAQTWVVE
jgi:Heterokaryon incompatibility protein (HET)